MKKVLIASALVAAAGTAYGQAFSEDFEGGIPASWTLVDNLGSSPMMFNTDNAGGRTNDTNGSGLFAIADSDAFAGDFDISMFTHSFVVPDAGMLTYSTNYQNLANLDFADVNIDVGAGPVNLLSWNEDHGGFGAPPGEDVALDLSAYAGETATIEFHYYDVRGGAWDWWWQIDDVAVTPAPSAMALLGLGGLVAIRRRR